LQPQSLGIRLSLMKGCLRFLRTLVACLAVVAYVTPVTAHGTPHRHVVAGAEESCGHDGDHAAPKHVSTSPPSGSQVKASDIDGARGERQLTPMSCCVAMCTPALPSPMLVDMWSPQMRATSERPIISYVLPAFAKRLDRPPKLWDALLG